ncbi:MAG: hypothetical protein JW763_00375 [candidate division Zixibacteria bacterium]|nr:hypothetical protein [candidate division Zixibacteria bacterium]
MHKAFTLVSVMGLLVIAVSISAQNQTHTPTPNSDAVTLERTTVMEGSGDGLGELSAVVYQITYVLGHDTAYIEGMGSGGDDEIATLSFNVVMDLSQTTIDSISGIDATIYYDTAYFAYYGASVNAANWPWEFTPRPYIDPFGLGIVSLDFYAGLTSGFAELQELATVQFTVKCQPNQNVTTMQLSRSGDLSLLESPWSIYPTDYVDGSIMAMEGHAHCYVCGDLHFDGQVNLLDILDLIEIVYAEGPAPFIPDAADVDHSGGLDLLDILLLIDIVYGE